MNSQRLEEIVAELMKPISDIRRSFDTDLSALLEEYLTEAGLHALEADEGDPPGALGGAGGLPVPNFAELALLLQQSACIYSRKVDCLYQRVLDVSDALQQAQLVNPEPGESESTSASPRKRGRAACAGGFEAIPLAGACAPRDPPARPPPVLPRAWLALAPRAPGPSDLPLRDLQGEPIGLLQDFHVTWRLQDGLLVEELTSEDSSLVAGARPVPLLELQAAIEAAAAPPPPSPPPPPATPPPPSPPASPPPAWCSTPLPAAPPPPPLKRERKRKLDANPEADVGCIKLKVSKELLSRLSPCEFLPDTTYTRRVLAKRAARVLRLRKHSALSEPRAGFPGWPPQPPPAGLAALRARLGAAPPAPPGPPATSAPDDSDDDGFFEQSSLGDSDASHDPAALSTTNSSTCDWLLWQSTVTARAERSESQQLDVAALGATLLQRLASAPAPAPDTPAPDTPAPDTPAPVAHIDYLLRAAEEPKDVSRIFLTTLFLANAGNVELIPGDALTLNSCRVRLVSAAPPPHDLAAELDE